ncbi:MAG: diacylglycerol kinase [Sphingomonadaceae bacterium]|nr:diacylglycerol kinase [Sphingomonadaceae bacterium]
MRPIRSAALVVNARSRKGRKLFRKARDLARELDFPIDCHEVRTPSLLDATVERALAKKPDLMIFGGGDGTISGLVDALVGSDTALAILPLGTANSFARTLGIPLDLAGAIKVIADGNFRRIDLGMIDRDYFANCAAIGISPLIAETVPHGLKAWGGRLGYLAWAAWKFLRFKPFVIHIGEGERERTLCAVEARISNGGFHGGIELIDEAELDSGVIVVQVVTGTVRGRLLFNWFASILRLDARHGTTMAFQGHSIRIATEPPLPISIDGEVLARTPVTAHVAAAVIEVAAPRDSTERTS